MKRLSFFGLLASLIVSIASPNQVFADAVAHTGTGTVQFNGEMPHKVVDPENPTSIVDVGDIDKAKGKFRIDFVPQLAFMKQEISEDNILYHVNAQHFVDDTGPRGNFIQVSDFRDNQTGWVLQLRQETQLINADDSKTELKGAFLSFDKSWTNSIHDLKNAPKVAREVIQINNIGETYTIAEAKPGDGSGTWAIIFGSSISNANEQDYTLEPRIDSDGNVITDGPNNQPVYKNTAITLAVPGNTQKKPGKYETELTWILSELP